MAKKEEKTEAKEKKNAVVFYIFANAQMWFVIGFHPIIHARYGSLRSHACENSAASVRQSRDSERKSAGLPAAAIQSNARKGVESDCVFSLSFRSFLSLFSRKKRERKGQDKSISLRVFQPKKNRLNVTQ